MSDRVFTLHSIRTIVEKWDSHTQIEFYKKYGKTAAGCCGYLNFFECPHTTHDELINIYCALNPPPPLVEPETSQQDYVKRVTSLLYNVSQLSAHSKLMTEYLLGYSLKDFASLLVSKKVDNDTLSKFESNVTMALDANNTFSIIFKKASLVKIHYELFFGILGLSPQSTPLRELASPKVCALLQTTSVQAQVLKEFLKYL